MDSSAVRDSYGNPMEPFSAKYHLPPTKFYVVDTYNQNRRVYEYSEEGAPLTSESWYLAPEADYFPTGATADATGTTVWVIHVDAQVYLYDPDGAFLGFWKAKGGVSGTGGITTDGTDIWIADQAKDRVLRYSGAALRIEGSQLPDASFDVLGDGVDGITTYGNTIWVVDNSTDHVYMYSTDGTYLNQWPLESANDGSSGLTIDPTGASNSIWVVDSIADAVFEYERDTGTFIGMFLLDTSNGNVGPVGIADPPPPLGQRPGGTLTYEAELPAEVMAHQEASGTQPRRLPMITLHEDYSFLVEDVAEHDALRSTPSVAAAGSSSAVALQPMLSPATSSDIPTPTSRATMCRRAADEQLNLLDDSLLNLLAEDWSDLP
jgi:hypothetical protein